MSPLFLNLTCKILHLEDDDNDSLFSQHALKALAFTGEYRRVCDVSAAIQYLAGEVHVLSQCTTKSE